VPRREMRGFGHDVKLRDEQLWRPFQPIVHFAFGLVSCIAVPLLEPAAKLCSFAFHLLQIVIGQLTPLLLYFSFELVPIAFTRSQFICAFLSSPL
jgi:hypothetical protein